MELKLKNLGIENFDVIEPTIHCIEILRVATKTGTIFGARLCLIVGGTGPDSMEAIYLPLNVYSSTAEETARQALDGAMRIFEDISDIAPVIDLDTGELVETFDLNDLFPDEASVKETEIPVGATSH
jgi:hypothetical protein